MSSRKNDPRRRPQKARKLPVPMVTPAAPEEGGRLRGRLEATGSFKLALDVRLVVGVGALLMLLEWWLT